MTTICEHPSDNRCPLCSDRPADRYKCFKHGISKYRCTECPNFARKYIKSPPQTKPSTCEHPANKRCPLCAVIPSDKEKCYKHGRRKYTCIECCGSAICVHGKVSYRCILCRESKGFISSTN